MKFQALAAVFAYLILAECRETSKTLKPAPTITSSLVNFGKMDVNLHFNVYDHPSRSSNHIEPSNSFLFSKPDPIQEPCPCSGLRSFKDPFVNNPSDLLNKILTSNDLFSHNKEPMTSTFCCDSHEHDDSVTFELGSRQINEKPVWSLPELPFIFEDLLPKKPFTSTKARAVEIIMLPKKQSSVIMPMPMNKNAIQVVGDKELRNDFKTLNFMPKLVSSVKKDLTAQAKSGSNTKEIKNNSFDEGSYINTNSIKIESTTSSPNALK